MSDLTKRLKELRGRQRQSDVADLLDVSAALISSWESGAALPPVARLEQYAHIYATRLGLHEKDLLAELVALRESAPPARERDSMFTSPLLDVLKDIRHLLVEIRDRLPPKG